jgi:Fe-S cluster assembly iron-binding protein IscA
LLTLTENAASAIRTLTSQTDEPDETGVRIAPTTGEGGTPTLGLSVTADPQPDDQVLEAQGARVFVDSDVAPSLEDKSLDAQMNAQGQVEFRIAEQTS